MAVIRKEKAAKVAEIKELLTASKCTILVDFCGLTVAQDTTFRRKMREAGIKYGVVKIQCCVLLQMKLASKV